MAEEEHVSTYARSHRLRADLIRVALGSEAETLLAEAGSSVTGRAAKTFAKEGRLRVTLAALRSGVALDRHQVAGPVSIQVVRGGLRLVLDDGEADIAAGEVAVLDARVAHGARVAGAARRSRAAGRRQRGRGRRKRAPALALGLDLSDRGRRCARDDRLMAAAGPLLEG